ncbi:MAG TPA: phospholipase D family protein [Chthoniobacterales bacterium]|nr:phospholipase D family protein [Chthoniobacterales bacterium]
MAEFLDTTAISYQLEKLLKTAKRRIVLISPYLKLRPRVRELIEDAARLGVQVQIVYGKNEQCAEVERLRTINRVSVTFGKNVHAKCYLNEEFGMVTSLNLYDFSQGNNQEMGVLFTKLSEPDLYHSVSQEALRIIRISGGETGECAAVRPPLPRVRESIGTYDKITTSKLAEKLGIMVSALYEKLIGRGYLELRDGGKRYLTEKGKRAGGEFRIGKGPYFLWPPNLPV